MSRRRIADLGRRPAVEGISELNDPPARAGTVEVWRMTKKQPKHDAVVAVAATAADPLAEYDQRLAELDADLGAIDEGDRNAERSEADAQARVQAALDIKGH